MKVILLKDVKGLGQRGEVLEAADGYARNFLIPRHLAEIADEAKVVSLREKEQREEKHDVRERKALENLVKKLKNETFSFERPADELGHFYVGLKPEEILSTIKDRGFLLPERVLMVDYSPIKTAGVYIVTLKLNFEIKTQITINATARTTKEKPQRR